MYARWSEYRRSRRYKRALHRGELSCVSGDLWLIRDWSLIADAYTMDQVVLTFLVDPPSPICPVQPDQSGKVWCLYVRPPTEPSRCQDR